MKNDKNAKKIINHDTTEEAEFKKERLLEDFIDNNRIDGKWFYLASSHNDCAEDHKPYQGRLYYDNKAPNDIIQWAKSKNLYSIQWVMGKPAWFITRPHCRHYFVVIPTDKAMNKSLKKLKKKYKTHSNEGDRDLATPKVQVIEEYEERLKMLLALYRVKPTEKLKKMIEKTRMLIKKWKNSI